MLNSRHFPGHSLVLSLMLTVLAVAVLAASQARAASAGEKFYLRIEGVTGAKNQGTDERTRAGWIQCLSLEFQENASDARGGIAGKTRSHPAAVVTMEPSETAARIERAVSTGRRFPMIELESARPEPSGREATLLTLKLKDAVITSYQQRTVREKPVVEVSFSGSEIQVSRSPAAKPVPRPELTPGK